MLTETTRRQLLGTQASELQDAAIALLARVKDEEIGPIVYRRIMHYADDLIFRLSHTVRPSQEDSWLNEAELVLRTAAKELATIEQAIARSGGPANITTIGLAAALPRRSVKVV